jgi:hypothetical protein
LRVSVSTPRSSLSKRTGCDETWASAVKGRSPSIRFVAVARRKRLY